MLVALEVERCSTCVIRPDVFRFAGNEIPATPHIYIFMRYPRPPSAMTLAQCVAAGEELIFRYQHNFIAMFYLRNDFY